MLDCKIAKDRSKTAVLSELGLMHRSPATSKLKHFDLYGKVGPWNMPSVANCWLSELGMSRNLVCWTECEVLKEPDNR